MGIRRGNPLADMARFVADLRAVPRVGELPPIILAALRSKMVALAEDIADGVVFANAARSHMTRSLGVLSEQARRDDDFFIGNMIPTCISNDKAAAMAVNRSMLQEVAGGYDAVRQRRRGP